MVSQYTKSFRKGCVWLFRDQSRQTDVSFSLTCPHFLLLNKLFIRFTHNRIRCYLSFGRNLYINLDSPGKRRKQITLKMFSWLSKDEARNKQPEIYDRYELIEQLVKNPLIFLSLNTNWFILVTCELFVEFFFCLNDIISQFRYSLSSRLFVMCNRNTNGDIHINKSFNQYRWHWYFYTRQY